MKVELEIFDAKERLPKPDEIILFCDSDGFMDSMKTIRVESSHYVTEECSTEVMEDGRVAFVTHFKETQDKVNENSHPRMIYGEHVHSFYPYSTYVVLEPSVWDMLTIEEDEEDEEEQDER